MNGSPLITSLEIEGFKSFGVPGENVKLGALNFLVGANASGKSNLLNCLRFLQCAVLEDAEYAVNEFGGLAEVRNKLLRQRNQPKPVTIRFHLQAPVDIHLGAPSTEGRSFGITSFDCSVALDLRDETNRPVVAAEEVTAQLVLDAGKKATYRLTRKQDQVTLIDPTAEQQGGELHRTYRVPEQEQSRLAIGVGLFSLPCVVLRNIIAGWQFFNISPRVARLPYREVPDLHLGPAGENLAVVLHRLEQQNGRGSLDPIIAGLKGVVPGFKGLKTTRLPVESKYAFQVVEEKIRSALNPDSVSDGTIRLLALMVIAHWSTEEASLVAVEEPENGIHPHLAEHIVQVLRTASERRQLLVTTHNPAFLDFLEPDEVILCDKVDGFTQLRRAADVAEIETFRKRFSLGDLWTQGVLGGIP